MSQTDRPLGSTVLPMIRLPALLLFLVSPIIARLLGIALPSADEDVLEAALGSK